MRSGRKMLSTNDPRVIELSNLLNILPFHQNAAKTVKFRNPNGVSTKLANFAHIDPLFDGKGMAHGAKADGVVFEIFSKDRCKNLLLKL